MSGRIAEIADKLIPMEVERLLGWEGHPGAAYNCISEDLCSIGLLNRDWSLSELGQQVAQYLKEKNCG